MPPINDALELLTAQHEELEDLFEQVRQVGDEAAFTELVDKLSTHLEIERKLVYPVIARYVPANVMDELAAEHGAIKQLLGDMLWLETRDASFRGKLNDLGVLLVGHSSWQEDELFTRAAETISRAELATLCDRIYSYDSIAIAA